MAINPYLCRHEIFIVLHNSLLSLTACIREDLPAGSFALEKGDLLPEFSISNPDGTVSNKDLENKFALIIFFSTTCSDCREAFPDISTLYNTYKDNPSVRILLIARNETEEQVTAYFRNISTIWSFSPIRTGTSTPSLPTAPSPAYSLPTKAVRSS